MGAAAPRHRRRRLDPHPGRLHRLLRHQADARAGAGLPGLAARHAGARRAAHPHGCRRGAGADGHLRAGCARRLRLDLARARLQQRPRRRRARPAHRLLAAARLRASASIPRWRRPSPRRRRTFESLGAIVEQADPDMGGDPIGPWNTLWWPSMHYQLQAFGDRWRELADPALRGGARPEPAPSRSPTTSARSCSGPSCTTFSPASTRRYDLLLTPTLPLPAFEVGDLVPPSGEWGSGVERLVALQLSLQPDDPAGGLGALRARRRRACRSACRSSAPSAPTPWCCVRPRLREAQPVPHARRAAHRRTV